MVPEDRTAGAERLERMLASTIAQRVREYRQQLELTIAQLSERTGLSKGMVSKIENAQASPSLTSLASVATALGVPVTALFRGLEEEHDAIYVPDGQGIEIEHQGENRARGHRSHMLGVMRGPKRLLEPVLFTLAKPTEVFPLYQHPGVEFLYMLEGKMEYGVGTSRYALGSGDSLQFEGEVPHGPTAMLDLPIRFLSIKAYDPGG